MKKKTKTAQRSWVKLSITLTNEIAKCLDHLHKTRGIVIGGVIEESLRLNGQILEAIKELKIELPERGKRGRPAGEVKKEKR